MADTAIGSDLNALTYARSRELRARDNQLAIDANRTNRTERTQETQDSVRRAEDADAYQQRLDDEQRARDQQLQAALDAQRDIEANAQSNEPQPRGSLIDLLA